MLTDQTFYHSTTKKLIVAFGNLFNDLTFRRFDDSGAVTHYGKVPIAFAPREKYMLLIRNALDKGTQIVLPRMSFFITGFQYDPSRAINTTQRIVRPVAGTNTLNKFAMNPVPWNVDFTLSIYARYLDDGYQIFEQIIPYYSPSFNLTLNEIDALQIFRDVPMTLTGSALTEDYELGADAKTRKWVMDLTFSLKTYYYGNIRESRPITATSTSVSVGTPEELGSDAIPPIELGVALDPLDAMYTDTFGTTTTKTETYETPQ